MTDATSRDRLQSVAGEVRDGFARMKRVMSFDEYFELAWTHPERQARSAAQYLRDVFDHFGTELVDTPRGKMPRWRLFDCPWDGGRDRLVGQEEVQNRFYRILSNFEREGRVNKLVLLHGPNGSAKSTFVSCLARALEHYSGLDEGALYRFNWIFPAQKVARGGIGFAGAGEGAVSESYAYLPEDLIDARLPCEIHDHPLFLIPLARRRELLHGRLAAAGKAAFPLSDYILNGDLGHKNRMVHEALLVAYRGDYAKLLRHVQVERFYVSRRYRAAAVTVEPQMAVDARARQITLDRSFASLPTALQSVSLYEYGGDLVDANRGLIEFSDLLKRPIEAYKYLLGTVESGRVPVENALLFLDLVFVGSSNDNYLQAFKEVPEFQSFRGRLELVRVPYLLDHRVEVAIYRDQVRSEGLGKHVAPHAQDVAALWAVLTRMRKPLAEKYPKGLAEVVAKLTPAEKADLYATGTLPAGLSPEQARELRANVDRVYGESDAYPNYEGRTGASPREVKTLLFNAAQNRKYGCLSPLAVFEELEELVKNVTVYDFLRQEPQPGGYHENRKFIQTVRERWLDMVDEEVRASMGLVEEQQYQQLFERYVTHVSHWVKKEKLRNPVTGRSEDPDASFMADVERTLGIGAKREEFRREAISRIGAWSLDHPGTRPAYAEIFPTEFERLRESYFDQRKKLVRRTGEQLLVYLTDGPGALDREGQARVERSLEALRRDHGYCERCARDAVSALLRHRYP